MAVSDELAYLANTIWQAWNQMSELSAALATERQQAEAEIGRLTAELDTIRSSWQSDVASAIAQAQTAEVQRDAARAEVMALSAHMIAHNVELQTICESQKRSGECSNAGMCDSCPRRWMIDALRESNDGNE